MADGGIYRAWGWVRSGDPGRGVSRWWMLVFFLMVFSGLVSGVGAGTAVDEALEDFAVRRPDVETSNTTAKSVDEDLMYFEFDTDGDGYDEIFVSQPDLAVHDHQWMLYRRVVGKTSGMVKVGLVTSNVDSMRAGVRDGVRGYYESYHRYGDHTDLLIFHAAGEDGNMEVLWREEVDSGGKDRKLWDAIHPQGSSGPLVRTVPVARIRAAAEARMEGGAAEDRAVSPAGPGVHPSVARRDLKRRPVERAAGAGVPGGGEGAAAGGSWVWVGLALLGGAVLGGVLLGWRYGRRVGGG